MYSRKWKRVFDCVFSAVLLIVFLPLLLGVIIAIKLASNGPVFFKQERVGRNKCRFQLFKFRTMAHRHHDPLVQTRPGDTNITCLGHVLRRLKIDEIPQLLNVLKGDMSLVGPRPCLPSLLHEMDTQAQARFHCRPGLTGPSQINGNIYLVWEERWRHDVKYIEDISFCGDVRILLKTVLVVVMGEENFTRKL